MSFLEMSEIPKGWHWATIPDIVGTNGTFCDGDWVESKDQDPLGDVRLIQLADVGDGEYRNKSSRFLTAAKAVELNCTFLRQGDVLIARMPEPLGRACIFPGDVKHAVTVVDVCIVRSSNKNFDHKWLSCFINAPPFRIAVAGLQAGSTRKRISRTNLGTISLPVPPLDEQRRIVAEIEKQFTRLDAGVAALKRTRANLKRYRAAVLKAACEGKLVPTEADLARAAGRGYETGAALLERILVERRAKWNGRGKYQEPVAPDVSGLPQLPEGWTWATAEMMVINGPQNGLYLPQTAYGNGFPILRIDDYQDWESRNSDEYRRVNASNDDIARYSLRTDDLVINRVNSLTHLGKCLVVSSKHLPAIFESNMMRLQIAEFALSSYICIYLRSNLGRKVLISKAKWAVNQASINQQDVGGTVIPLPPLAEQQRIVAEVERRLSVIEEMEAAVAANLQRAARLRLAVLARVFAGEL